MAYKLCTVSSTMGIARLDEPATIYAPASGKVKQPKALEYRGTIRPGDLTKGYNASIKYV